MTNLEREQLSPLEVAVWAAEYVHARHARSDSADALLSSVERADIAVDVLRANIAADTRANIAADTKGK